MHTEYGNILTEEGVFKKGRVCFDETIQSIELDAEQSVDDPGEGPYIIPGLVDIHTHGAAGSDFCDASPEGLRDMSLFYAKNGVTSFLATSMSLKEETLSGIMNSFSLFERPEGGARCIGVNLEGPFLSLEKKGAHPADGLHDPDVAMFERLNALTKGNIKLVSIAPELPGAADFIREVSKTCRVSLAHSAADYDTASKGFENGATHVTHLFNAMNQFLSRDPAIIGAAMDAGACVEIICDGIHLHPAVVRAVYKLFPGRVCMISDSVRATGLPDGEYELGGLPIIIKDGMSTLLDGTIAGSIINLMEGVRRAVSFGIPLNEAVTAAAANNARAIGEDMRIGSISPGLMADIVVLDKDLNIIKVYIGGREL